MCTAHCSVVQFALFLFYHTQADSVIFPNDAGLRFGITHVFGTISLLAVSALKSVVRARDFNCHSFDIIAKEAKRKSKKFQSCARFEVLQKEIIEKLQSVSLAGGNLIIPLYFFRYNASYYKVTEKVDVSSFSIKEISELSKEQKLTITLSILHSIEN